MANMSWIFSLFLITVLFGSLNGDANESPPEDSPEGGQGNGTVGGRSLMGLYSYVSPCSNVVCMNGGTCVPTGSNLPNTVRYRCRCLAIFHGTHCEHRRRTVVPNPGLPAPTQCFSRPCLNGGTCYSTGIGYSCQCLPYFAGPNCQTPVRPPINNDICSGFNPCNNMCECIPSCRHSLGYYCRSPNGYLGKNCTIPPPNIQCLANQIIVTVDDAFVREYDLRIQNSRLYLGRDASGIVAPDCYAVTSNGISHTFTIPLPFRKCGTNSQAVGDRTVVTNIIWLNRFTNAAYDMPVPVISFECTYTKEYIIVTSVQPAIDQPSSINGVGITRVRGLIELCKVSSACPNACPAAYAVTQGAVYTVGEMIHLNIKGDPNMRGIVALKTLYLSCTDGQGNPVVQLVTNGCPGRSQNYMPTLITHSGVSPSICVSFQVPRLQGCAQFFVHAELETCGGSGCVYNPGTCGQPLLGGAGRRRRSLNDTVQDTNVFGPIYVIHGERGIPMETLFPNTTIVSSPAKIYEPEPFAAAEGSVSTLLVVGLSFLCFLIVLSITSLVVYRLRYSTK